MNRPTHYHLKRTVADSQGLALDRVYADANAARSGFMQEIGAWALFGARVTASGEAWYATEVLWAEMALDVERASALSRIAGTARRLKVEVGPMRIAVATCRGDCSS